MAEVSARVGGSKQTLYSYFASKEGPLRRGDVGEGGHAGRTAVRRLPQQYGSGRRHP
ncbi:TetR family transcriptional regulator [Caulobacter sp. BP25]|uniref:TetR family transcriptional regulator n=1 Tax=Caulobacter sp. BP25 TaxID=2048900 RepID=UPI001F01985F|nr:TetR family transcriptional regulator [Caulobacter sp. BP25]